MLKLPEGAKEQEKFQQTMRGCLDCHQLGNKATRELSAEAKAVGTSTLDAWDKRTKFGPSGGGMGADFQSLGEARQAFADWTDRIAKGELPKTAPPRVKRDAALSVEIRRVFDENFSVYGVRKVWRQLVREGHDVARCTVARLMKKMALRGVIRGARVRTTVSDRATPCPLDHVNRKFRSPRPNVLWVSDFTYVATWTGFVYVAFVIDAYARRIVGWRVSRSAHAGFVLDALEQALHERKPVSGGEIGRAHV